MDELKCPGCQQPVGEPVRPGLPLHKKKPISDTDLMICFKCFEIMQGTKEGTLRILTAKERTYVILFKPGFIRMLQVCWAAQEPVKNAGN
jgi:hypothetical protein